MLPIPPPGAPSTVDRDAYGFLLEADDVVPAQARRNEFKLHVLPRQQKTWAEVASCADIPTLLSTMRTTKKLKTMVRDGIPDELRPRVWASLAGASSKCAAQDDAGYYERLIEGVKQREDEHAAASGSSRSQSEFVEQIEQIEKDLARTFPSHPKISTPEGQASLRRLLRAYCIGRNPHTGYCQGMNFLAAMLLLVMTNEQEAFWMFVVMVERLLPADYFTDGLLGVRVDSNILIDLLQERLPTLHAHFEAIDILPMITIVTNQWFISLFVFWLPTETLLRVWDCFFFDGLKSKNKTFFRVALTVFKLQQQELMQISDVQSLMDGLRKVSRAQFDADALIHELYNKAWLGRFSLESVEKKEQVHRLEAMAMAARRAEKQSQRPNPAPLSPTSSPSGSGLVGDTPRKQGLEADEDGEGHAEAVAARVQRLSLAFDADESDEEAEGSRVFSPSARGGDHSVADLGWPPRGYLLKRSPAAKSLGLLKKFAWQRRWFELTDESFCWYTSSTAASAGQEPLGRVPRSMVISARPAGDPGGFEVDLGNRVIRLALDGIARASLEDCMRSWVRALTSQEVVGSVQDESCNRKKKPWKEGACVVSLLIQGAITEQRTELTQTRMGSQVSFMLTERSLVEPR